MTSTFTYDALGNLLTSTSPGNNAAATITTTNSYTADGSYTQNAAVGQPVRVTDNLGKSSHFRYDARGNCTIAIDPLGNEVDATYNLADQVTSIIYPATGQTGTGHSYVTYVYQYVGGPLAAVSLYNESNQLERQVIYTYGAEGELTSVTGSAEPVAYTYDASYRLTGLADGNGHSTTYGYNTAGYLSSVSFPGGGSVSYPSYDPTGNVLQRVDGRGVVTNYVYNDPGGALTDIQYPAATSLNIHFGYDSYGRCTGRTDGAGGYGYTYDDRDGITSTTTTYTGLPAVNVSYSSYPDASRQGMVTPAGNFSYSYDANGRMATLTSPYGETSTWSYLDNGLLAQQQSGNGVLAIYTYNALGQLLDLKNQTSGGTVLSEFGSMTHDAIGNRLHLTAIIPGMASYAGQTTFAYDTKDQISSEQSTRNSGYNNSFGYDFAGNPTTFKGLAKGYNANNQDATNVYDLNGNPTTYQGVAMSYDPENHLTAVGTSLSAGYRADGLRAWKQSAAGRTYFAYDAGLPLLELNASGSVVAVNTFGENGLLSRRDSTTVFYAFDPQGSIATRSDASGAVLSSHLFDAFGAGVASATATDPFKYDAEWGYYTDTETGLVLCGQRFYDSASGRFLNRDPIGATGGINLYGYTGNNPENSSDPSGNAVWRVVGHRGWEPQPWHHMWIDFTNSTIPGCRGKGYGLWPGVTAIGFSAATNNDPASWNTDSKERGWAFQSSSDGEFERELCKCITMDQGSWHFYFPLGGESCYTWIADMWACAQSTVYLHHHPSPTYTGDWWVPPPQQSGPPEYWKEN